MITHSKSFSILKEQNQSLFDFTVLCCYAVPALNAYMKAVEKGAAPKLPDADYFKGDPDTKHLKSSMPEYRKNLGKLISISSFSYFESYFQALIKEVLDFHGGQDKFVELSLKKQKRHLMFAEEANPKKSVMKLREYAKHGHELKYIKHARELDNTNYRFPSELFATFGIVELGNNYKELKAVQIPHVAKFCFGVDLTDDEVAQYSKYRELRNDIAHGKVTKVDLKEAINASQFLRTTAMKIDGHVVQNFLVLEPFVEE